METTLIVLGVIALAAFVAVATVVGLRNGIVSSKNRVKRAWADVIAYQRKKLNVIPALEQGLKDHQAYEQGVLREITALRSSVDKLSADTVNLGQLQEAERHSRSLIAGLRVAVEAYPVLKTSELYAGWKIGRASCRERV